eukprot:4023978-Amphidinium_carterae.1
MSFPCYVLLCSLGRPGERCKCSLAAIWSFKAILVTALLHSNSRISTTSQSCDVPDPSLLARPSSQDDCTVRPRQLKPSSERLLTPLESKAVTEEPSAGSSFMPV